MRSKRGSCKWIGTHSCWNNNFLIFTLWSTVQYGQSLSSFRKGSYGCTL